MFEIKFPLWIRILIRVLLALLKADPPKNGDLDEDKEA